MCLNHIIEKKSIPFDISIIFIHANGWVHIKLILHIFHTLPYRILNVVNWVCIFNLVPIVCKLAK